jgi:hypothetical protein
MTLLGLLGLLTRVDLEDFPRPLVEAVLVLGGNAVADLELGGLCRILELDLSIFKTIRSADPW